MEDVWTLVHRIQKGQTVPGHPHESSVRDGTNIQTYINIQCSIKNCLYSIQRTATNSFSGTCKQTRQGEHNWHYYKFNFKMGINKTQPILEPLL